MDLIREHLIYSEVPITICLKTIKPQEQYELIRLLLATRTKNVFICTHDSTNDYIDKLLKNLDVKFTQCHLESSPHLLTDHPGFESSLR